MSESAMLFGPISWEDDGQLAYRLTTRADLQVGPCLEVWRCVRGDDICRTVTPALIAKGEFVGVHVDCGPVLAIPVSDGGSET